MQNVNFKTVFENANRAYEKRNNVTLDKMQSDLAYGLKVCESMTEPQLKALAQLGVNWDQVAGFIGSASNVKKAKRLPQFLKFIVTADGNNLQGSAKTALIAFCALMIGAKNKNGLKFTATGKGDEMTSDSVTIEKARKIQKLVGKVEPGSYGTQVSVSLSDGGILPALGICAQWSGKGDSAKLPELNLDNKLTVALVKMISTVSDGQIELWAAQSGK